MQQKAMKEISDMATDGFSIRTDKHISVSRDALKIIFC